MFIPIQVEVVSFPKRILFLTYQLPTKTRPVSETRMMLFTDRFFPEIKQEKGNDQNKPDNMIYTSGQAKQYHGEYETEYISRLYRIPLSGSDNKRIPGEKGIWWLYKIVRIQK